MEILENRDHPLIQTLCAICGSIRTLLHAVIAFMHRSRESTGLNSFGKTPRCTRVSGQL
jgi:hypothetical protein